MALLSTKDLRRECETQLGCASTQELVPYEGILGQKRALKALEFGLGIQDPRFNIYVAGEPGTGRSTAVNDFIKRLAKNKSVPDDWCYVYNFSDSYQPRAINVPPGKGSQFVKEVTSMVDTALKEIPKAFESEQYAKMREEIVHDAGHKRDDLVTQMNTQAEQKGFVIQASPVGVMVVPVAQGKPLSDQEVLALPPQVREKLTAAKEGIETAVMEALREIRRIERATQDALSELDRKTALTTIGHHFDLVREQYKDSPSIVTYLEEMREDMIQHLDEVRGKPAQPADGQGERNMPAWMKDAPLRRYAVNQIVDNSHTTGAPVIMELNPTYNNLFGRIEKEAQMGVLMTDLTLVRSGSLHIANGGYIVIPVDELLRNPLAYEGLKRAMRSREIVIEEPGEKLGLMVTKTLRPQAIPLAIKVVLIGTGYLYQQLFALDPEFNELFKVKAEFDVTMDRTDENVTDYGALLCRLCQKEHLLHLSEGAVCKVIEYSSRLAEDQQKLSTRFAEIADVLREASFYASSAGSDYITEVHVNQAVEERNYRSNLIESKILEFMKDGVYKIGITGSAVGEINGLSVMSLGDFTFGRPSRITVSVSPGREGIVDIERDSSLSGPIHSKGVMILGGYIMDRFAKSIPVSLAARLVFEQSYGLIDGDSASSAELYCLLSALSGVPIKRGFAVTGSVNQRGEVQAIGGVNEKIEGFFEYCSVVGLDGLQGVVIPESNVRNLMLKERVVDAVREGKFAVHSVSNIDEGIALLTGVPAGAVQPDGSYPEGTINYLVQKRLDGMAEQLKIFGADRR